MENNGHNRNNVLNPFSPHHPAQPEYFAGRKQEIMHFRKSAINSAKLRPPTPVNFAILGNWGMGKTSLLYEFRQIALEDLRDEINCVSFYFPLSPQSSRTWETFTDSFLKETNATLSATEGIRSKILEEVRKWQIEIGAGVVRARRKETPHPDLIGALENFWKVHLEPKGTQIAFIFLDDLHYFPLTPDDSSYLNLRTTFQELANRRCNYSLIVTAHTSLFTDIADVAEPLTRFFSQFNLAPFTIDEAREAIEKRLTSTSTGMTVEDDVVRFVHEKTAGHPYMLMFVMYELLTRVDSSHVSRSDLDKNWPAVLKALWDTVLSQRFRLASWTERRLMIDIAKSGRSLFSANDFHRYKGTSVLLSRLEEKELVIKTKRGQYALFHPLFADYLRTLSET